MQQTINLKSFLLSLSLSLAPLTTAIPHSSLPPAASLSSSIVHETPAAFGTAGITNNTATCPPSHASKQCCTNIGDQTEDVFHELGAIVPLLSDVNVNSRTGLSCNAVVENSECGLSLMCCSGKAGNPKKDDKTPSEGPQEPGTPTIFQSGCIPFNDAVQSGKEEAAAAAASSSVTASSSATATPSPTSRRKV